MSDEAQTQYEEQSLKPLVRLIILQGIASGQLPYHKDWANISFTNPTMPKVTIENQMNWREINGWFTEADAEAYRVIVESLPSRGGRITEVGVWMGRSTGALIEQCKLQGKTPAIYAADTFKGSQTGPDKAWFMQWRKDHQSVSVLRQFKRNMAEYNYPFLHIHTGRSTTIARQWPNRMFHAVFIDANHAYHNVVSDIKAWLPKIRTGGIIAGHDIDYGSVRQAVIDTLGPYETHGRCWLKRLTGDMRCHKCNTRIATRDVYCLNCGNHLTVTPY